MNFKATRKHLNDFTISENATKKQSRSIKNIIKLDKNFKITIDGDIRYLEKGFDEHRKLNFYKLFFRDEEQILYFYLLQKKA